MKLISTWSKQKIIFIALVLVLLTLSVVFLLKISSTLDKVNEEHQPSESAQQHEAQTSSAAPTAQEDFTGGNDREIPQAQPTTEGTVVDTNGEIDTSVSPNNHIKSSDGKIIVYKPTVNALLTEGQSLQGTAQSNRVAFRLIDSVSGVIAQGDLNVVNGRFSGKFNFSTTANEGRLDIFSVNPDGTESSNIEIPVKFR